MENPSPQAQTQRHIHTKQNKDCKDHRNAEAPNGAKMEAVQSTNHFNTSQLTQQLKLSANLLPHANLQKGYYGAGAQTRNIRIHDTIYQQEEKETQVER